MGTKNQHLIVILQVCLKSKATEGKWYLDSGCSRHTAGDKSFFTKLSSKDGGFVTFEDNKKGKIIGIGSIGISLNPSIENVLLVDGLKHNLLSISQL